MILAITGKQIADSSSDFLEYWVKKIYLVEIIKREDKSKSCLLSLLNAQKKLTKISKLKMEYQML